jgi:hypothetical protein
MTFCDRYYIPTIYQYTTYKNFIVTSLLYTHYFKSIVLSILYNDVRFLSLNGGNKKHQAVQFSFSNIK